MIPLTLEEVIDGLSELEVKRDYRINSKGLYCPDRYTINYNPRLIDNEDDFYVTILHELAHHNEEPGLTTIVSEFLAESIALDTFRDKDVLGYLQMYFHDEVMLYWG